MHSVTLVRVNAVNEDIRLFRLGVKEGSRIEVRSSSGFVSPQKTRFTDATYMARTFPISDHGSSRVTWPHIAKSFD